MNFFHTVLIVALSILLPLDVGEAAEGINLFDFLMSSSAKNSQNISFSPDDGKKYRRSFEQKYGPHGKLLIESMGQGKSAFIPPAMVPTKVNGTKHVLRIKKRIVSTTTISNSSPLATTTSSSLATSGVSTV